MNRIFIKKHTVSFALILFVILYALLIYVIKPGIIYNRDGSFREFGIGKKNKSIINIMIVTIILAILSYFTILYYNNYPHIC
jgi:hypothetical protein